jgi:hypothetical protein
MADFVGTPLRHSMDPRPDLPAHDMDHTNNKDFQHPWMDSQAQVRLLRINAFGSDASEEIDCSLEVFSVVDLQTVDYIALSYFWGEARTHNDVHQITVDRQRYWVRTNLWTFFQSVRDLDHSLPIYIDAICLDQLDNEEREHQVKLMSEVYSHANHAFVWLGNPHAEQDENLQSLRHDLTAHAPNLSWNPQSLVGLSYLCSRDYWRRLWIVQELLLSRTAIIHCGRFTFSWEELSQLARLPLPAVIEKPDKITWWDAWVFPRPDDFSQQIVQDGIILEGWQFALRLFHYRHEWLSKGDGTMTQTSGLTIHRAVTAFQFQQCRVGEDKIYALIGLLDAQGKSMVTPSYRSSRDQLFVDTAAACLVSRWRERIAPTTELELTHDDRVHCDRLNTTLELPSEGIEARIAQALEIAASYTCDTLITSPTQSHQPEQPDVLEATSNHATTSPEPSSTELEPRSADTGFEHVFRDFVCHLTSTEKAEFAEATPRALNTTIAVIQKRQRANKELKDMTRLKGFIEQVTTYHEVLDVCLGVPNVIAFLWVWSFLFLVSTLEQQSDDRRAR